jgi:tetratricopeptide (TPR) repeat protein
VRIFVFGESAAFGDPQPAFGLPRMIQALLGQRYPGVRFEVVNAAMLGINSHGLLPIAQDCAQADGDIWVIYMGNNEVVGPFGAGTVFGPQAPSLRFIRGGLALKTTRTGQLLEQAVRRFQKRPEDKAEWGGMLMFLKNRVSANDPRLAVTYRHFERNLEDMLAAGRRAGVGIVVSTVAVNLKDCAPFATAPPRAMSEEDREQWRQLHQRGLEAQEAGKAREAAAWFRRALQLDDSSAELQFRCATAALAGGDTSEAQRRFALACDLDTLRFRCDRKLNEILRRAAAGRESEGILFVDAEAALARQSPGGLPGKELFHEHVHLTFEGNYHLAWNLVEQIEKLLPETVRRSADAARLWATSPAGLPRRRTSWGGFRNRRLFGRSTTPSKCAGLRRRAPG